jgi:DNA repair protein SbcD/Mre11
VDVWIEKVQCSEVRLPLDRSLAAARPDAVGDVIRLVDELLADDAVLSAWARQALDDMKDLPRELSDAHPGQWDAAQWREALQAAEASVLAHLGSGASGAETDAGARP